MARSKTPKSRQGYQLNAAADVPDIRDRIYEPALVKLPNKITPKKSDLNIRDQGQEGACVGFSIAAAIDALNSRKGRGRTKVSARMLYEMAKRFDEWTGENYDGTSLRGGIRGWYQNGVCDEKNWPYDPQKDPQKNDGLLTVKRAKAARLNTLGAYYRLRPNVSDYHAALSEAGVVCASARVHKGWDRPKNGVIEMSKKAPGGHAFAIVGYDAKGFLIQNSWGTRWGNRGLALWTYEDWERNIMDAWVFRLAIPSTKILEVRSGGADADPAHKAQWFGAPRRNEIAGHFVHIDDGNFHDTGRYHSNLDDVRQTAAHIASSTQRYKHLLFYAHGGLNSTKASATRIKTLKDVFKENGIYPFHFMYDTGLMEELKDVILRRSDEADDRVGGFFDYTDRIIEKLARVPGTAVWDEMKKGAESAFTQQKAGFQILQAFGEALNGKNIKIHLAGHSTGAIFMAHLLNALDQHAGTNWHHPIDSCSLLAPACTNDLYRSHYKPRLTSSAANGVKLPKLHLYNLTDELEQDDTVTPFYRKSLLYLVSNAFERSDAKPLLGMQKFNSRVTGPSKLKIYYSKTGSSSKSKSETHGGFDNDPVTMNNVLKTILGRDPRRPFTEEDLDY